VALEYPPHFLRLLPPDEDIAIEREADLEALIDPFTILRLLLPRPPIWLEDVVKGFIAELSVVVVVFIIIINEKILKIFCY
jgi:hypothetical protein